MLISFISLLIVVFDARVDLFTDKEVESKRRPDVNICLVEEYIFQEVFWDMCITDVVTVEEEVFADVAVIVVNCE